MQPSSCASARNFCLSAALRSRVSRFAAAAAFALVFALALFAPAARAQSVTFAGVQSVLGSGFSNPQGVAVDASGNVYVVDQGNAEVKEILAVNGLIPANPTINVLGSGFTSPSGVAVDASGNVYVADAAGAVYEILAVNGVIPASNPTINVLGSGFSEPSGVAVDASGNVYVADSSNEAVYEILAVNGSIPASNPTINVLGSGFFFPYGVAVDASGNVYVADTGNSEIKEILAVNGVIPASNPTVNVLGSGFSYPYGVAVDASGNVYVADTANNEVEEILAVNGSIPASNPTINLLAYGFSSPYGPAVGATGNVYVADSGNNRIVELQLGAVNFASANVCPSGQATPAPCSNTLTLSYNIPSGATVGSVKILTQGAAGLDFQAQANDTNYYLCSNPFYSSVNANVVTCEVDVTFAPLAPGQRVGAVQITDTSGNVLVTTPLYGTGTGPQLAFLPGTPSIVPATGLEGPTGTAVDGAGNVYIADPLYNAIFKVTPQGTQTTVDTTIPSPVAVAVDGGGNLYATTAVSPGSLYEIPAGTDAPVALQTGYSAPYSLAVDGAGNIYVSDFYAATVYKVAPGGATQTTIGTGFTQPLGLAVDAAGDLFVADFAGQAIFKITPNGAQTTVASGIFPSAIAVDAADDLFASVVDPQTLATSSLIELPANAGPQSTLLAGLTFANVPPLNIAASGTGDLYLANLGDASVHKVQISTPPALAFASTNVGATGSPQSITVQNIGNAALDFSSLTLSFTTAFGQVAGSGTPTDCASSSSLVPAAECSLNFDFTPQSAGPINATATITDNNLNASGATQTISLSGTGKSAGPQAQTISFGAISAQTAATTLALSATATSGLPVSFASTTPSVCTVSGATASLVAAKTCTIVATQAGDASWLAATPVAQSFTVNRASQTVSFPPIAGQVVGATVALNATATSGLPLTYSSETTSICSVSGATATMLAYGTCRVKAAQAGNAEYNSNSQSAAIGVQRAKQTIDFAAVGAQPALAVVQLSATSTSGEAATFSSTTPSVCTVSGSTATMHIPGECNLTASVAQNGSYSAATASQGFAVRLAPQTVTFAPIANQPLHATVTLDATATSGLPVVYSTKTPATCTVSGSTATAIAKGTCRVEAVQSGNAVYNQNSQSTAFGVE